ncbi:hypothetical protein ACFC1R_24845 [Kitasatospora sp. NPDC056138]|uniref:hypothetical protein n=1 Tax=Kitasatospora sp. NPDC056138 TaxID=3345724 RepID=UPI0035DB1B49
MSGFIPLAGTAVVGAVATVADRVMAFLDYFAGVLTLLSLTAAVVCGLAATDRLVLTPRSRVATQSVHRATAVAALGFLTVHVAVKVAERHAAAQTAVLPFTGGAAFAVTLGTVAADLLVLAAATGAIRGRFAGSRRPWLWRVLHATAYACWPIALAHGLTAGRQAHAWVLWGYGLCAAAVALALLVRALGAVGRRTATARHRRGSKAYRPAAQRPAALAALSTPSVRPWGTRPIAWADPSSATSTAPRGSQTGGRQSRQPGPTAPQVPRPLRVAEPGGGR